MTRKVEKSRQKTPGSGRTAGTPNKKTQDLMQKCDELGVDPFTVLLLFIKGDYQALGYDTADKVTSDQRLQAAKEASKYLYPQRKAVEFQGDQGPMIKVVIEDYGKK